MEITNKENLSGGNRITVIDALRGFSLIGICLIHSLQHFGAIGTSITSQSLFSWETAIDEPLRWFINYFIFGKFFIIFSWLFGLSFFIQMDRAARKGIDFRPRFLWRLTLLLLIGFLHGLLVRIDILLIYALLGFILVFLYKCPTKFLTGVTLFLFLGGATLLPIVYDQWTKPSVEQLATPQQTYSQPQRAENRNKQITRKAPTLVETVKNNAWNGVVSKMRFQLASGRLFQTLGLFILGLIVGRIRLFEQLEKYRKRLIQLAGVSFFLILMLYLFQNTLPPMRWGEMSYTTWLHTTCTNLINLLTAYLWVFLVIEIYRFHTVQKNLSPLVQFGRMGLTNYIVQSVIGVCIFSGFGLDWSSLGVTLSVLVGIMITCLQIWGSHSWLNNFRYGPLEWIWRSGTYLKIQPLKK